MEEAPSSHMVLSPKALGQALPEFEVMEIVGRGGMGTVYRAKQFELDREVAIKVLAREAGSESAFIERFSREAQVTAKLDHPSIVPVYSMGYDAEGRCYYTMRLVQGRELGEVFRLARAEEEGWNQSRVLGVLVRVCQAIAYAHGKGVVHRDLKPFNIMVGALGEVYVMDWGLAKMADKKDIRDIRLRLEEAGLEGDALKTIAPGEALDSASPLMTMDGSVLGTPAYMPPEQALGKTELVDHLSDIYSLGAILYELLAGHPPYIPTDSKTTPAKVLSDVVSRPIEHQQLATLEAPRELVAVCAKAMARERSERYQTAIDLSEELQAYLDGRVVRAHESGTLALARKWVRRNRALTLAMTATLLCLIGIVLVQILSQREIQRTKEQRGVLDLQRGLANAFASFGASQAKDGQIARAALWYIQAAGTSPADPALSAANLRQAKTYTFGQADARTPLRLVPTGYYDKVVAHPTFPATAVGLTSGTDRWRIVSFREEAVLFQSESRPSWLTAFAFDPTSDQVALAWDQSGVEIRRLSDQSLVEAISLNDGADDAIRSLAFSPNGTRLFIGTGKARLWERASRTLRPEVLIHEAPPDIASFSADGSFLVTDCYVDKVNTTRVFEVERDRISPCYSSNRKAGKAAFANLEGTQIVVRALQGDEYHAQILETSTGKFLKSFPMKLIHEVAPEGGLLLGETGVFHMETGRHTPLPPGAANASFSLDLEEVAIPAYTNFYAVDNGTILRPIPGSDSMASAHAYWEGRACFVLASSIAMTLWRTPERSLHWAHKKTPPGATPPMVSQDGFRIQSGNEFFEVINERTGEIGGSRLITNNGFNQGSFLVGTPWLMGVTSSPDKPTIVRFWDWRTGYEIAPQIELAPMDNPTLQFSADGNEAILTHSDGCTVVDLRSINKNRWDHFASNAEDLRLLAEIQSTSTIDSGQLRTLTAEELFTRWKAFRTRYPEFHQIAPHDPAAVARFHRDRALQLEQKGNAYGAQWHRERATP